MSSGFHDNAMVINLSVSIDGEVVSDSSVLTSDSNGKTASRDILGPFFLVFYSRRGGHFRWVCNSG